MANNRIFLVHEPSLTGVCLGKSMMDGWYVNPNADLTSKLELFYRYLENEHNVVTDDASCFAIWNEHDPKWRYAAKDDDLPYGLIKFEI